MKTTTIDDEFTLGKPFAVIKTTGSVGNVRGVYYSRYGIVHIQQWGYQSGWEKVLHLEFCYNNKIYRRRIDGKIFTEIGIARKAGEFVREIFN